MFLLLLYDDGDDDDDSDSDDDDDDVIDSKDVLLKSFPSKKIPPDKSFLDDFSDDEFENL